MALHCEGPTDRRFLEPLIRRALVRLVGRRCVIPVDVAEHFVDLGISRREHHDVARRIAAASKEIDLLFIHADGRGDPDRTRNQQFEPIVEAIRADGIGEQVQCLAVVPVRETEAWLLADPSGIRNAFHTQRSADELNLPLDANQVERLPDPKAVISAAYDIAHGPRRRRRGTHQRFYGLFGERIDLARLDRVPAFRRFEQDLTDALQQVMPDAL